MCSIKRLAAIIVLASVAALGAPHAFAGDMGCPGITGNMDTPAITGDMHTPGINGDMNYPVVTGDMDYPITLWGYIAALFG